MKLSHHPGSRRQPEAGRDEPCSVVSTSASGRAFFSAVAVEVEPERQSLARIVGSIGPLGRPHFIVCSSSPRCPRSPAEEVSVKSILSRLGFPAPANVEPSGRFPF